MKKFLLLRSNKQSGPYSAEELQQMGLKPYDLIWVDGKSAAWRYPSEVDELKAFAPAVEEQPYDRFYKKQPEQENKLHEAPVIETPVVTPSPVQSQPVEKQVKKEKEYKRVFVTLPAGASTVKTTSIPKPAVEQVKNEQYQPPVQKPAPEQVKQNEYKEPVPAAQPVKPSRPIKEAIPETQADIYPRKRAFKLKALPLAAIFIGMIAMIGLGIVIGISINNNRGVSMVKKVDQVPSRNSKQTSIPDNSQSRVVEEASNQGGLLMPDSSKLKEPAKQEKKLIIPVAKKTVMPLDSNQQDMASNQPVKTEPDTKADKEESPSNTLPKPSSPELEKLVTVSNNNFEVGPFGGISRLSLTLKNSSEYALTLVVVQVDYLKANKEVYKTENLYFRDVAANSSLTLEAPRSNRGNKINYKVKLINSKDHLFHAGN